MIVIEAPSFSRRVYNYLSDDEYAALQWSLTLHPETGAIVPGSGGLRKLRWAMAGKGIVAACASFITGKTDKVKSGC